MLTLLCTLLGPQVLILSKGENKQKNGSEKYQSKGKWNTMSEAFGKLIVPNDNENKSDQKNGNG